MNYTMGYKSSFGLLMGCLLMAGQPAHAQVSINLAEQPAAKTKVQESRLSTLKKRLFSTTGAVVVLGVCCCALTYWCLQLHKSNVALVEEAKLAGANFVELSERVHDQGETVIALGNSVSKSQEFVSGRLDLMEKAVFNKKNNDVNLANEMTDAVSVNKWVEWFDKTASGTQFAAVQVSASPLEQHNMPIRQKDDCNIQ